MTPLQKSLLKAPLEPTLISQREGGGGKKLDYIEAHSAIENANRIFGFDGWNYEVEELKCVWEGKRKERNGEVDACVYLARVCVRVNFDGEGAKDAWREDVGYGDGTSRIPGAQHELAAKEAVSDALKRALRSFGDQFGNTLYQKDHSKRNVSQRKTAAQAKRDGDSEAIKEMLSTAPDLETLESRWRTVQDEWMPVLPTSWADPMSDFYLEAKAELEKDK